MHQEAMIAEATKKPNTTYSECAAMKLGAQAIHMNNNRMAGVR